MLVRGILNPQLASLLARIRHTNTLVIADRGFPFWPELETVDLSLVDGIPSVPQVLDAVLENWKPGRVFMAEEFRRASADQHHRGVVPDLDLPERDVAPNAIAGALHVGVPVRLEIVNDTVQELATRRGNHHLPARLTKSLLRVIDLQRLAGVIRNNQ